MTGNGVVLSFGMLVAVSAADQPQTTGEIVCEGTYAAHLQGVTANERLDAFYWSFTRDLIRTDREGAVVAAVKVPGHHGDLTWHGGRVYVAVKPSIDGQVRLRRSLWSRSGQGRHVSRRKAHPTPVARETDPLPNRRNGWTAGPQVAGNQVEPPVGTTRRHSCLHRFPGAVLDVRLLAV